MKPRRAVHFAVIIDRRTGSVVRIFNPTYEYELSNHHLAAHEKMLRLKKARHGISRLHNGMTLDDVARLARQRWGP